MSKLHGWLIAGGIAALLAITLAATTIAYVVAPLGSAFLGSVSAAASCATPENTAAKVATDRVDFTGNPIGHTIEQNQVANIGVGVAYAHTELSPEDRYHLAKIVLIIGWVESNWRNVRYGDATSLGWIQQQSWWGTVEQRTNVETSTELLISGGAILPRTINGRPDTSEPGILDLEGWQNMPAGEVAWRVQQPRKDLRGKYALEIPRAERFLQNRLPAVNDPRSETPDPDSTHVTEPVNWSEECVGIDPAGLGTKDGFTFPVVASKSAIIQGATYNGERVPWCYKATSSCHHDYAAADIHVPPGTTVVAAMSGVVVKSVNEASCEGVGDYDVPRVTIRDPKTGNDYYYTHLTPGSVTVSASAVVEAGQPIGTVGPAECAQDTAPHLHINATRGPMGDTSDPSVRARMIDLQPLLVGAFNAIGQQVTQAQGGWVLPIESNFRISSEFGPRLHPKLGYWKPHTGVDMAAPRGTPVRAAASGTVVEQRFQESYGNTVVIDHGNGVDTRYSHLDSFGTSGVVTAGTIIGYVGTTGLSTGYHTDFKTRVNGEYVDPIPFLVSKGVRIS